MPEYVNPNKHTVYVSGQDGTSIAIKPYSATGKTVVLPEYFERYVSKGFIDKAERHVMKPPAKRVQSPPPTPKNVAKTQHRQAKAIKESQSRKVIMVRRHQDKKQPPKPQVISNGNQARKVVGTPFREDLSLVLANSYKTTYPISNGIGVGILSYNRPGSLQRLAESILRNTDLSQTTVFISDDASTDTTLLTYLKSLQQCGFVVMLNESRLGVAGNTNRLMRCLSRFENCLILNDDVEVMRPGWDTFYSEASKTTKVSHFCMQQAGVYGASRDTKNQISANGLKLLKIQEKPHGAVLAYTSDLFKKVGYFDRKYGMYGMEHVDWSKRAMIAGGLTGYLDVAGSDAFFKIHADQSAAEDRQHQLSAAKAIFDARDWSDIYLDVDEQSAVPEVSYVIPVRSLERTGAIDLVLANIKGQRFPVVKVIVPEHDVAVKVPAGTHLSLLEPCGGSGPFNKSKAFNTGVAAVTTESVILHDADMMVPATYTSYIYNKLKECTACHVSKIVLYTTEEGLQKLVLSRKYDDSVCCDRSVGYFEGGSLACRVDAYWNCGGFNEDFVGYGVEDCDFYYRLSNKSAWFGERIFSLVHLWHGRSPDWMALHAANIALGKSLEKLTLARRISSQYGKLSGRFPALIERYRDK